MHNILLVSSLHKKVAPWAAVDVPFHLGDRCQQYRCVLWGVDTVRVRVRRESLHDKRILHGSIRLVIWSFISLTLHCKQMDSNTSRNPICGDFVPISIPYSDTQVFQWGKPAFKKANSMFQVNADDWDVVVEDVVLGKVTFRPFVWCDNPLTNLYMKQTKLSAAYIEFVWQLYRVCRVSPHPLSISPSSDLVCWRWTNW